MPELPEVESVRKLILEYCIGKTITNILAPPDTKIFEDGMTQETLQQEFQGRVLEGVNRKGKYFWLQFKGTPQKLVCHLGMSGYMTVKGIQSQKYIRMKVEDMEVWPPKFMKYIITFDDGTELGYGDARRFGRVKMVQDVENSPPIIKLGFDPLTSMIDLESFKGLLMKRSLPIKALLLDQAFAAGVGNYYADEVLYQARVYPDIQANQLTDEQIENVHKWIQKVAEISCACNDTLGEYPIEWLFHYRWSKNKVSQDYFGNKILFDEVGGRTTAYVPALQKKGTSNGAKDKDSAKSKVKRSKKESKESEEDIIASDDKENQEGPVKTKQQKGKQASKVGKLKKDSNQETTEVVKAGVEQKELDEKDQKRSQRSAKVTKVTSPKKQNSKKEMKLSMSKRQKVKGDQDLEQFKYGTQDDMEKAQIESSVIRDTIQEKPQKGAKGRPKKVTNDELANEVSDELDQNIENVNTTNGGVRLKAIKKLQKSVPSRTSGRLQSLNDSQHNGGSKTINSQNGKIKTQDSTRQNLAKTNGAKINLSGKHVKNNNAGTEKVGAGVQKVRKTRSQVAKQ